MSERAVPDLAGRTRALDPRASFIVQAPAGSGKTELLIQRYLALLAGVERPEEIAAITFTIKAAAEMRRRVFGALHAARHEPRPAEPHHALTWDLARAALARNDALGWKLEESAERLRVQTIDALCASLTRQMPVLSRFGAQPESVEDASAMYLEAARNLLAALEGADEAAAADVARLLSHLDNDAAEAEKLLVDMLATRDHWVRTLLGHDADRATLERALAEVRAAAAARARAAWPARLAAPRGDDVSGWVAHAESLLTKKGEWRSRNPTAQSLLGEEVLREALAGLPALPPPAFDARQWDALEAIVRMMPRALAELQLVFARRGQADFVEIAQGALRALEDEHGPTELMLVLDYRIRHLLVDEFQDTSHSQFQLLERLTAGWEPGDGRTLFLVGDPMQSIYRFRQAEVALFLRAWEHGIGGVALETVRLSANFRSQAGIVDWVNASFQRIMPGADDLHEGAVRYAPSQPIHAALAEAVHVHPFVEGDDAGLGSRVARIVQQTAGGTTAILVRSRRHLQEVMPRLREAGVAFRAVEIEPLGNRPVVQDLLALTRALSHLADRIAWLAVLRAPWCGLTLADLTALGTLPEGATVWAAMNDPARLERLTRDGRERLEACRATLACALANRRRSNLRAAVEATWLALGGPACVERDVDLGDADIYLDHLEGAESGGSITDLRDFEGAVERLFALPDLEAPEAVQVMTIHNAKGLEFDTVIIPGMHAGTVRDDRRLFMWMETALSSLLIAPIDAAGSEADPIYRYIRELDKRKADHEAFRLLYVAATRARKSLHLLGCARVDAAGVPQRPAKGSLLAKLWPVVCSDFDGVAAAADAAVGDAVPRRSQGLLRRLAAGGLDYEVPAGVAWSRPMEEHTPGELEYSWVGDLARRIGAVVHRWLQRIAGDEARGWDVARLAAERGAIRKALMAAGVAEAELEVATDRVLTALGESLEDPRGRWLLGPQRNARNEYRLSTVVGGVRHRLVVDRLFEDVEGRTWIVDYKTSLHQGGGLEGFLATEQERYRDQLERYAAAVGTAGARRALYFPLLRAWREWGEDAV